ncbi:MAG: flippase [Candidatus Kerfeldbacteria bacterium]|nr:flippase [Candidatus Kerfeldbacteria bacterium]
MALTQAIAKNTTYLSLSSIFQKLIAFWFFTQLAHQLGDDLGKYSFALSFTGIFVILMNFGLVPVLTRQGARTPDSLQRDLNFMLAVKIVLTAISLGLMIIVFSILNYYNHLPAYTVLLVYVAGIVIILDTFRSIFLAVLRARQQMQFEAIGQIIYQLIVVIGGMAILSVGHKALGMIIVIIGASLFYLIYSIVVVIKKLQYWPKFDWQAGTVKQLLLVAAPFVLADVFFKLNGSIDTVMLEYLAGDRSVAWYSIALKLTVTLTVIPGAFATAFFPAMSRAFQESLDTLRDIFERATAYLLILSVPITVGAIALADQIIALAFPKFPATVPALQIFMGSVVFLFANYPVGNLLNAANRQGINTLNMGLALAVNIILNIILIPRHTYIGAAIAGVVSAVVLVALGLPHVYRLIHFNVIDLLKRFGQIVLATSVMTGWILVTEFWRWPFFIILLSAMLLYFVALYSVRGISKSELQQLYQALLRRRL